MTNKDLYHEVIEIRHVPDNELICLITSPYFKKHELNKILGKLTQITENFVVKSYQKNALKDSVRFGRPEKKK